MYIFVLPFGVINDDDEDDCADCRRMRHMEFNETGPTSFRNRFGYNNVMYLVAGCVAERLSAGQPLERLMADRLFRPLGMNDSHFISEMEDGVENDARLATMYFWNATAERLERLNDRILRLNPLLFDFHVLSPVSTTRVDGPS